MRYLVRPGTKKKGCLIGSAEQPIYLENSLDAENAKSFPLANVGAVVLPAVHCGSLSVMLNFAVFRFPSIFDFLFGRLMEDPPETKKE